VRTIREELGNHAVRIVLRTGQPGQAPEENVIVEYDINDYKAKTELTTQKLFTTVIAALRSYNDIIALETNRRGLCQIIESTEHLFELRSMKQFAAGVLTQLSALLSSGPNGILCAQRGDRAGAHADQVFVLAGAGRFAAFADRPLDQHFPEPEIMAAILETLNQRHNVFGTEFSALYIPVPDGHEVAAWVRNNQPLEEMDRTLLEVFTSKIAISFSNVTLYEQLKEANEQLEARVAERTRELAEANGKLERLATLDPLTGISNRRHFMDRAMAELQRARRQGHPVSLLLIDLDHFKRINDTGGHAAGDAVLRAVVERIGTTLRTTDTLARYGGEEFVVLLPEANCETARATAERIRLAIAATPVAFEQGAVHVTASIGVAEWRDGPDTLETALRQADAALYQAKADGRDRVVASSA
ncbi:MAG TPA: diguanylate cyclase, partial [Azospirillaceae bacterium]|nr:diguanylate cyclase [Azospirillaceae bacterium]